MAIIVERLICFYKFRYSAKLIQAIKEELKSNKKNRVENAKKLCVKKNIFSDYYKNTLENLHQPLDYINNVFSNLCQEYVLILEKRLTTLSTIATVAPLFGILGTVLGMIDSFIVLNQVKENNFLIKGIAEALFSTAFGLVVAIPAIVFYNFFARKIDIITKRLENDLSDILLLGRKSDFKKSKK